MSGSGSPINLLNVPLGTAEEELRDFAVARGQAPYRGAQIATRIWKQPARSFDAMTELPRAFRERLAQHFTLPRLEIAARQLSRDGTEKFLFRLPDGEAVETVAIPDGSRLTLCISSQAGCALACTFCATGRMGFRRNLELWEIAAQVREMALLDSPLRATNVVFMGMGEPMMNWKAVDQALTVLNSPDAMGIGARHITVSTVGIVPGIVALGERPEQFRLALSIHAPSDDLRRQLMPINVKYPLTQVIEAAKAFERRVTFEYVMLGATNDGVEHALQLAALARECRAFVNLIPLHPGGAPGLLPSTPQRIIAFARELRRAGVEVAIRKSRGIDIAAACGQLRIEGLSRRTPRRAHKDGHIHVV